MPCFYSRSRLESEAETARKPRPYRSPGLWLDRRVLELEDGRADRLEEEREAPEDGDLLPNVGLARDDEEDDGPVRLLRLEDVAPTVGRR